MMFQNQKYISLYKFSLSKQNYSQLVYLKNWIDAPGSY